MGKLAGNMISKDQFKGLVDGFIKGIDDIISVRSHGYAHNMDEIIYENGTQHSYQTVGLYRKGLPEIIFTSESKDVGRDPLLIAIDISIAEALSMEPEDNLEFVADFINGMKVNFDKPLEYNDFPTKEFLEGRGMDFRMYLEQCNPEAIKTIEFLEVVVCSSPDTL